MTRDWLLRTLAAISLAVLAVSVVLGLWFANQIVLSAFAGILLAVVLRGAADWVAKISGAGPGWALVMVIGGLVALAVLTGWLVGARIAGQVDELSESLPRAAAHFQESLRQYAWGRLLLEKVPQAWSGLAGITDQIGNAFSGTLDVLASLLVIVFLSLYLAADPGTYRQGALQLFPAARRGQAAKALDETASALRWWMAGRLAGMTVVAVLSTIGLLIIGVPLALTLGLLAGLFGFVPNVGPVVAAVPALLLALTVSPEAALWTLLLYVGVQAFESYLITPLIESRTVSLPPALVITGQVFLGVLLGFLGLMLATPIIATLLVIAHAVSKGWSREHQDKGVET